MDENERQIADELWSEFLRKNAENSDTMAITFGIAFIVLIVAVIVHCF